MQLLFPGFLFGLCAVAIPLVIHLLQLRRLQRIRFTNTEFIRQLELTAARQRQLKQWLVLLLRILALTFLVLAFCQPFIPSTINKANQLGSEVDVFVDTSPSMQVPGENGSASAQVAVAQAQHLGKLAERQVQFRLLSSKGQVALSKADYLERLETLSNGQVIGVQQVGDNADNSRVDVPLYIFSDFQKNEVSPALVSALGRRNKVVLVSQARKSSSNVYVDSVWLDDAFVRTQTNVGLHLRLRNGGQLDAKGCPVKVFIGAQQVGAFRISVGAGKTAASLVQIQLRGQKIVQGRIVTEDAPVRFDNAYYFTLQPTSQIRVHEIGAGAVTESLYQNEPVFSYSHRESSAVDYNALRTANIVLLRETSQISKGLRDALQALVKRGGSLVVVPSADVKSRTSYLELFRALGIGMPQWEQIQGNPELREVAMPAARNAFFQNVFGGQQSRVTMPQAAPILRWNRTDEDILKFRDGDSYLAGFKVGAGKVYVFSAPFETQYSDFVNHALFVPVLYRLAMLSYQNDQLPAYRLTQKFLNLTVPRSELQVAEASYRLVKDSLALIPTQRVQGQDLRLELPVGLTEAGFYQLRRQEQVVTTLAFNQDKRESELAAYSASELRQLLGKKYPNVQVLEGDIEAAISRDRAAQTGQPLWRYCLVMVLVCLLAEGLLLRVGRRAQAMTTAA